MRLRRAYERVDAGDHLLAAAGDVEGALGEYEAAHRSQPDNLELAFWHGVALAANGREEDAAPIRAAPSQRTRAGSSCSSGCPPPGCSRTTAS